MNKRTGEKIKLTSYDELPGVPEEEVATEIGIERIHGFENHPFKVLDDKKMDELVESIRTNGILTPVLVRPDDKNGYEMISGHRRILYVKSFLVQRDCSKLDFEEDRISRSAKSDTSKECDRTVKISEKQKSASKRKSIDGVSDDLRSVDLGTSRGVDFDTSKSAGLGNSRGAVLTPQEVPGWAPPINNTKENDIKESNNKSNHIVSEKVSGMFTGCDCDMISEVDAYEEIIKENIGYDDLLVAYPFEREMIEGIMQMILETILNKNETMVIASNTYPVALVKSKFLELNYSHIEYVMDCCKNNTSKVKNIKR